MEQDTKAPAAPMNAQENERTEKTASMLMKIFAIIGIIAMLALAAWISITVIRSAPNAFSLLGSSLSSAAVNLTSYFRPAEEGSGTLSLTLDNRVINAGEPYTFQWTYPAADAGTQYRFSFTCADEVTFAFAGEEDAPLSCEETHEFEGDTTSLVATPHSPNNRFLDVTVTVAALSASGNVASEDSALITIVNREVADSRSALEGSEDAGTTGTAVLPGTPPTPPSPSAGPTTTTTVRVPAPVSDPNGTPDLAVRIIATGVMVEVNDNEQLVALSPIPTDRRAGVRFEIENVGTKTSEEWDFEARLPIEGDDNYRYDSPSQQALRPGDKIEFTLGFDDILQDDRGTIVIRVNPSGADASAANNTAQTTIAIDEE